MIQLVGLMCYEFKLSIRRKGLWIAYALISTFFILGLNTTSGEGLTDLLAGRPALQEAAEMVYVLNMSLPLIAGVLAADRMQRDVRLNLRELQLSSPLKRWTYILGKYGGVLLSTLLAALACVWLHGLATIIVMRASPAFLLAELLAFVVIVAPAFAFVTAFSLACPLIMPLRVYQILFTGYWLWGNYINKKIMPTLSDTLLNASGVYALQGFFHGQAFNPTESMPYTSLEAWLNILVIGVCTAGGLLALDRYLAWQSQKA